MDSLADTDRALQRKRKLTNVVIGFIFLLSGIEYAWTMVKLRRKGGTEYYIEKFIGPTSCDEEIKPSIAMEGYRGKSNIAVILPTVWMYLQSLGAQPFFLGLVLSAFSLTELLASPIFGHWSDRTGQTKSVILLSNCFEIAGNFMYFVGISKWFLLGSRLVAGVGSGSGSSIFGYLTRSSSSKERIPVFAMAMACRQAGLLIGPAFNIFLRYSNFQLGPFHVNKFSAPGLFMCALWTLMQLMVLFMFYDFPLTHLEPQGEEQAENRSEEPNTKYGSINTRHKSANNYVDFSSWENADHPSPSNMEDVHPSSEKFRNDSEESSGELLPQQSFSTERLLREEVVVLLTAQFVTFFNQTALETLVTPLAQTYLGFQDLQNSLLYFLCGIEMLLGFLVVRILSRCCTDRLILVLGLIVCNISCIWCVLFLAKPKGSYGFLLGEFVVGVFLQVLGLPFVAVSQVSLFSKVTSKETQGFNHGLRRSVGGLATILGPLWAAGLTNDLYIMLGVMMGLLVLLTGMVSLSYQYLVDPATSGIHHHDQEEYDVSFQHCT